MKIGEKIFNFLQSTSNTLAITVFLLGLRLSLINKSDLSFQVFPAFEPILDYLLYSFLIITLIVFVKRVYQLIIKTKLTYKLFASTLGQLIINGFLSSILFICSLILINLFRIQTPESATAFEIIQIDKENSNRLIFLSGLTTALLLLFKKRLKNFKLQAYYFTFYFVLMGFYMAYISIPELSVTKEPLNNQVTEFISERSSCNKNLVLEQTKKCTLPIISSSGDHGSGFSIIDGYVFTNRHVIEDSTDLTTIIDGKEYDLSIFNYSNDVDIAILKLPEGINFPTCNWFDSDNLNIAEDLYAMGWPLQYLGESTVTRGIFSRRIESENGSSFIQTDTPVNPGNSGGPLINECGVVAVITSKNMWFDAEAPVEGSAFALSSKFLEPIISNLMTTGEVGMNAPIGAETFFSQAEEYYENQYLDVNSIRRYLNELYDVRASWEGTTGVNQEKYNKLMDLFNRQIEFCNHLVKKLSDGQPASNDDIIMWNSVVDMSDEAIVLSNELINELY